MFSPQKWNAKVISSILIEEDVDDFGNDFMVVLPLFDLVKQKFQTVLLNENLLNHRRVFALIKPVI